MMYNKILSILYLLAIGISNAQDNLLRGKGEASLLSAPKELVFKSNEFNTFYSVGSNSMELPPLQWSNLVFIVSLCKDKNLVVSDDFYSWMQYVGEGLDVIFMLDEDDDRTLENIFDMSNLKPTFHVYRASTEKDGRRISDKVVGAFLVAESNFGHDENKHFYVKLEPESAFLPLKFMSLMSELYHTTYPKPVDFGRPACSSPGMCHSQGGIYGMSRSGLKAIVAYLVGHPEILKVYKPNRKTRKNLMDHEDFATSYLYRQATGYPLVSISSIKESFNMNPEAAVPN